jgi:N-acetylmuramoyl-L-alanine amidase
MRFTIFFCSLSIILFCISFYRPGETPKVKAVEPRQLQMIYQSDHRKVETYNQPQVVNIGEWKCLSENIYWEARGEGYLGMAAVAHVTLNRLRYPERWGSSICEVVHKPYQFSWTVKRQKTGNREEAFYGESGTIASKVITGELADPTDGATWFHTVDIKPVWASQANFVKRIGNHVFYKE